MFPKEKQAQAFSVCADKYVSNLEYYLKITKKQIESESAGVSENDAQEIYDRLVVSSLNSIRKSIDFNANSKDPSIFLPRILQVAFESGKHPILISLLSNKSIRVRASVLDALNAILTAFPTDQLEKYMPQILKVVLPLIDEKERSIQASLWRGCLLNMLDKATPAQLAKCDMKMIETKSIEVVRHAASGIGKPFYASLTHFLSKLPIATFTSLLVGAADRPAGEKLNIEEYVKERFSYYKRFFAALVEGLKHDEIKFFGDQLIQSFFESVFFVVLKRISVVLSLEELSKFKNLQNQAKKLIRDIVCSFITHFLSEHIAENIMSPMKTFPHQLAWLLEVFSEDTFKDAELFTELIEEFAAIFAKDAKKNPAKFGNFLLLLSAIGNSVSQKSRLFSSLESMVLKIHEELLNDLKTEIKPIMNDSHIEKMLPIATMYMQYTAILKSDVKTNVFSNVIGSQKTLAEETLKSLVAAIISNVKTIASSVLLERLTTQFAQIFYDWMAVNPEETSGLSAIIQAIATHVKLVNQLDPKVLLHLQIIFHFALPETASNYFSSAASAFSLKNKTDLTQVQRSILSIETNATAKKRRTLTCSSLKSNTTFQELCLTVITATISSGKMDRLLGVSIPLLVIMFKNYLSESNQKSAIANILANLTKKRTSVLSGSVSEKQLPRVFDEIELTYLFFVSVQSECDALGVSEGIFDDFFTYVNFCFTRKLRSRITTSFDILKLAIKHEKSTQVILANATNLIQESLQEIFITEQKQQQQGHHSSFGRTLKLIQETLSFLATNRKTNELRTLANVILSRKFYSAIIFEQRLWVLMKVVFEEIMPSIDFNKFLREFFTQEAGFWLISNLLCCQHVFAIIESIQLKKYFKDIAYNFINPLLLQQIEEDFPSALLFISSMMDAAINSSLIYGNGLKQSLKQMLADDGISINKQTEILQKIVSVKVRAIFNNESTEVSIDDRIKSGILLKNILPLFSKLLSTLSEGEELNDLLTKEIRKGSSHASSLSLGPSTEVTKLASLIAMDIQIAAFPADFYMLEGSRIHLTEFMLESFAQFNDISAHQNYISSVFFAFLNIAMEKAGSMEPFTLYISQIENHIRKSIEFNSKARRFSSNALISLLAFLRKIIASLSSETPIFSSDFAEFAVQNVIDTCLLKLQEFAAPSKNNESALLLVDESNDAVIVEFAETISRFVTVLSEYFDENLAYELLNSSYPAIQKSAFLLLRQFYTAFAAQSCFDEKGFVEKINKNEKGEAEDQLIQYITSDKFSVSNLLRYLDVTNVILTAEQKESLKAKGALITGSNPNPKLTLSKQSSTQSSQGTKSQSTAQKSQEQENTPVEEQKTDNFGDLDDDDDEFYNQFINNEEEVEDDADDANSAKKDIIDPSTYGHLLTWISLVNKLNAPATSDEHELIKKGLNVYLEENKFICKNFLSVLFQWIEFLEIPESKQKDILTVEEVQGVNPEWSDFLSKESLFALLVQSLYLFTSKFPLYFRNWLETTAEKKFVKAAQSIVKNFISEALYLKEVDIIELSQMEWQSDAFTISVVKRSREINAVYTMEEKKLEIFLQVPQDYPIKQIVTEVKRGVKISPQKTSKWMLMMKSLLLNHNNTIKNALLMWKDNLDKELDGVDECAICYYVICSVMGGLPKMPCKTCKKKFHSTCIQKWFKSSSKSLCPLCKSQFL